MRHRPQDGHFTDVNPDHRYHIAPNGIIKAERLLVYADQDDDFFHLEREVIWHRASDGAQFKMKLVPHLMASGAADITHGTFTTAADGSRTYTPSNEGKFLYNTSVLVPTASAPQLASNIEGMLFPEYFIDGPSNESYNDKLTNYCETLEEGDFFYVIREFDGMEVYASETITSGLSMISSGATAGAVADAAAVDTGGTVAAYHTSLMQNIYGTRGATGMGQFTAARTGAGLVTANLRLPPWIRRTTI